MERCTHAIETEYDNIHSLVHECVLRNKHNGKHRCACGLEWSNMDKGDIDIEEVGNPDLN